MGWLILRISQERTSRDSYAFLVGRCALGEPRFEQVATLAAKHGFEVAVGVGAANYDRERWPMRCFAYTSRNKDGYGRCGGSIQCWLCAPAVCKACDGLGTVPWSRYIMRIGAKVLTCRPCKGLGRIVFKWQPQPLHERGKHHAAGE